MRTNDIGRDARSRRFGCTGIHRLLSASPRVQLLLLVCLKALVNLSVFAAGSLSVSSDEFARAISAVEWSRAPLLVTGAQAWLPFERYLNGSALMIWPDPILVPRLSAFGFSCLLLVYFYRCATLICESRAAAFLSSALLVGFHWYAWLSGTPMLEIYFVACLLPGIWSAMQYLRSPSWVSAIAVAVWFFAASGFHYQAWVIINAVFLLSLRLFVRALRKGDFGELGRLLLVYIGANLYVVFTLTATYLDTGNALSTFGKHADYSRWFYGGYAASVLAKLAYYPDLVLRNANPFVVPCAYLGIRSALRSPSARIRTVPLVIGGLTLLLYSIFNVFSAPATAAPGRFSLFFVLVATLYAGSGLLHILERWRPWARRTIVVGLVLFSVVRLATFPAGVDPGAFQIGRELRSRMTPGPNPDNYVVELIYWQFLGVELGSDHFDQIRFDRSYNPRKRDYASRLETESAQAVLESVDAKFLALRTPALKALVSDELEHLATRGRWSLYELRSQQSDPR